jgi:arsenate reductase
MSKRWVLFLCTGNACRSQMAEGWARHLKREVIEAYSAGIETHGLNPRAVQVMAEAGVDISHQRSKHVSELKDITFDYVITVCGHAHEHCPVFAGATKKVHAGFDDPPALAKDAKTEEEALAHYRRVRDEIRTFVEQLPAALEQPTIPPVQSSRVIANKSPNPLSPFCKGSTGAAGEGFLIKGGRQRPIIKQGACACAPHRLPPMSAN